MKARIVLFIVLLGLFSLPLFGEMECSLTPATIDLGVLAGYTGRTYVEISNLGSSDHDFSLFEVPDAVRDIQTAYYPFDAYYTDLFTCSTGTISDLPFVADRASRVGSAVHFNGSGRYTTRDFALENNFSLSFWAKPDVSQTIYGEGYYGQPLYTNYLIGPEWGGATNWGGFGIALGTNGILLIEHGHGYMPCLLAYEANLTGWHHYTITFANHAPKLYLDGVLVRSGIPSQRTYTRLSHEFGGYVYGNYSGTLDELSIYSSSLNPVQVNAVYTWDSQARYRVSPQTGTIPAGGSQQVMLKMVDASLPLGVYHNTFTFCQGGAVPEYQTLPVNLTITDLGPLAPASISISRLTSGDVLLQWQPVTQDTYGMAFSPTRYRIYRSDHPGTLNDYTEIGQSTNTQFVDSYDPLLPDEWRWFYLVRAE